MKHNGIIMADLLKTEAEKKSSYELFIEKAGCDKNLKANTKNH